MSLFCTRHFRKPQLIPLLFILISTVMFTSLGAWQLARLQWKEGMLREIEAAQSLDALGTLPENLAGLEFRKVALTGMFHYDKALHLIGRQRGNFPGYFILTPFTLEDDGRVILVNRGFSPPGKETRPAGPQTVTGVIRPAREKRYFAAENAVEKNVWFYEDISAMSQASGLALSPLIVEETGPTPPGTFPVKGDGILALRNDHLGYAITWFATAFIGLVMFGFYYRKTSGRES